MAHQPTDIDIAFAAFQAQIGGLKPPRLPARADADEVRAAQAHLDAVLKAAHAYAAAVVAEVAYTAPVQVHDRSAAALLDEGIAYLSDCMSEIAGEVDGAANRIEEAA